MKLSASRLKSLDYKQLMIDHGEKFVAGVIGLSITAALWGTNWKQFEKAPAELIALYEDAQQAIHKKDWPEEEARKLKAGGDFTQKLDQFVRPVDNAPFRWTTELERPLHPERKRISNPKWLPVEDLIADAGVVMLQMDPSVPPLNEDFDRPRKKKEKESRNEKTKNSDATPASPNNAAEPDSEFLPRGPAVGGRGGRSGMMGGMGQMIGAA